jgi:hypothetical protein
MKKICFVVVLALFWSFNFYAQDKTAADAAAPPAAPAADLAKAAANPIANMISLPFQFNFNMNVGQYQRYQGVMNFEPVLPFKLSKTWNVVTRTIIPIINQPVGENDRTFGIGNTNFNAFFVPKPLGIFTYGFGLSMNIPTASAPELGGDAFGLGPTIVFLFMPGHWVVGATAAQVWGYKSPDGSDALNSFFGQYFITYNIKNGWYVNTTPTISANFNADEGEQWTVPVGAGFGKVQHFKKVPIKFQLQYYYNVAQPDSGAASSVYSDANHDVLAPMSGSESSLVFQIVFLFPHKAKK